VRLPGGGVYSRYVIRTRYRHALRQYLQDEGIGCEIPAATLNAETAPEEFPNAWAAGREALALPMHPLITPDEVLEVTRAVRQFGKFSAAMASEPEAAEPAMA
jgi:dTDP-4-amino-4,6-dideoxygalactose transaminase